MQDLPDQHAGHAEIVGVFARPSGLSCRIDHGYGFADYGEVSHFSIINSSL
jgi:hypothetical protein